MKTDLSQYRSGTRPLPAFAVLLGLTLLAGSVFSQTPPAETPKPTEQARVPTSQANVHRGPSSGQVLLVVVPKDTVMPILSRRGEWVEVQLRPELRKTGMVYRWYQDEKSGWMHDSTVEITPIQE